MSDSALPPQDKEMTLVQHLLDLKTSLTRGILAIIVVFLFLFPFANEIYTYIAEPLTRYLPEDTSMIATAVASPFLTPFKLSFVLAIYIAMPFLLYQLWRFIAPALYSHEKQLIGPVLFFSSFLFYSGGAFAYYVVFPLVFGFLSTTAPEGVTIATDIAAYLDFVIKMFFAFGMAFEVPIITVLLILTGMVRAEKLAHARPYIVVGAFVIGMLLTPPDIISQTLLAVPMWLLFELGLLIGGYIVKKRGLDKDEDDADYDEDPYDMPESQAGQQRAQATSSTNSQQTSTTQTQTSQAIQELDQRYADQVDDDLDWDDEFDKIDDQMRKLEREYQARKDQEKAEKDAAEQGKKEDNQNGDTSETAEKSSVDIENDKQGKPDNQKS
ncbi:twin-arginine translocase subunit TatC [Thiomicrorhabdus sp. 6S2-11]|uniref:Sec-independent protein translocase protein TatC n=1 Tax=Thiomicrorhabdus marina TaxID=2818442 RepID=A0ABS3Q2H0_9GAMM|nr:twin-arginine translocase subunit TatC [Thiomicrorhabdus marina]MBO1926534.1 twin-arginine translocase subunit TatC [Thiomicrorhabdus marina]